MQVIATAGHVDHGKSTLVRALTGMEPDRWAEERRRGLTIDLGFAWMTLPSGQQVAFVDVPGHERFVPNMLAGVGAVPAVLFTVAADEGWMPQSEEHLAAVHALGMTHGLLAVTRSDLADPADARRQALGRLAVSSLGEVEAVAVSARTGLGLPALRDALDRLAARLAPPDPAAPVRLWVDRAFRIRGSGTVVTGTLPAGTIAAKQELLLTPSMETVRVRGIETLKQPAGRVSGVARVALNLRGAERLSPARGMALVEPGRWTMAAVLDVRLAAAGAGRRGSSPCTRARPGPPPGSGPWAASSPGSPWTSRCRCTPATGCCSVTPDRPRRPSPGGPKGPPPGAPGLGRPGQAGHRGRPWSAPPCWTWPRPRSAAGETPPRPAGNSPPGRPCPPPPTCCGGTACCAALTCGPWE